MSLRKIFSGNSLAVLLFSLAALYVLAPTLDKSQGYLVSTAFALILIFSSGVKTDRGHIYKYAAYVLIAQLTYYILFDDQPWDFFLHGGMYESSAVPLVTCSLIMSFAGWLLLDIPRQRIIYSFVTLVVQIPIGIMVGGELFQKILNYTASTLNYTHIYDGSWEAWQFEWMLNYYLPVFLLTRLIESKK